MGVRLSKFSHQLVFLIILPILSATVAYTINRFLPNYISSPWIFLVDSLGVLGTYSFLFKLFDTFLWQFIPTGVFQIVDVPNLNGTWVGKLRSSYDQNKIPYNVRVEVFQTFSNIKICSYFSKSWSFSIVSDFYEEADGRKVLHYVYKNEPRNNALPTMNPHYGSAKHEYIINKGIMECSYYNEPPRNRGWYGSFNVKRTKRSFLQTIFPLVRKKLD